MIVIPVVVAVIVAGIAAIVVMNDRAAIARAQQAKAESDEIASQNAKKKAASDAVAEQARAEAQENAAKAAEENRKAKEAEVESSRLALEKSKEDKAAAIAGRAKAEADAKIAAANRDAEKAKAETARQEAEKAKAVADAESAKAQVSANALEKERLIAEKVIAEAKAYELKQLDLATFERELLEFKRELDEREAALHPEKTIDDLEWVSKEDTVFDEQGVAVKREKKPYLAENDRTLPRASRELARTQRLMKERDAATAAEVRETTVGALEKLYVAALRSDRVVDAEFYRKTIKSMYPDWKYQPPAPEKEAKE